MTNEQAYAAMYAYLDQYYQRTKSNEIAGMLSCMSLLQDGTTADSAIWFDWMKCVDAVQNNEVDTSLKLVSPEELGGKQMNS